MTKALQHKCKIDNGGGFDRELLAKFDRRSFVTDSGCEEFHVT
jgi:hypothetical protein